jgi:putative pyruvate formate lyase activating enzyme
MGFCAAGDGLYIGSICLHQGEEPPVSGEKGICNIFFQHCNLNCVFCQNHQISRNRSPLNRVSMEDALESILKIYAKGSGGIGLVSPSHLMPQALRLMENIRLQAPEAVIVYNTNGYDKAETIRAMDGLVDVYLPDYKYSDGVPAREYSSAEDYPDTAIRALREMYRQKGSTLVMDEERGIASSGIIIRHLVLPGAVENSIGCLENIAMELSSSMHISLMSQYRPTAGALKHPPLNREITEQEYNRVVDAFHALGFRRGWVQQMESSACYNPDFTNDDPFGG